MKKKFGLTLYKNGPANSLSLIRVIGVINLISA